VTAPKGFKTSFRDVFVRDAGRVYFVAGDDEAEKKDIVMSWVLRWTGVWGNQRIPLRATGVTIVGEPDPAALFMGIDGVIARWGAGAVEQEIIDPSDEGPQRIGDLRDINTIAGKAYVVGMGRTVYWCDGRLNWKRIDAGIREGEEEESDAGLNSIDGWTGTSLVTAGFEGEIWSFNGKKWTQHSSPTNLTLNKVVCMPDKQSVICGQMGTVLQSSGRAWKIVENDATEDEFWGAAWFKDAVYLSTLDDLYRLRGGRIEKVKIQPADKKKPIELSPKLSFFRLHSDGNVLWSIGRKQAMYSSDGDHWTETPYK